MPVPPVFFFGRRLFREPIVRAVDLFYLHRYSNASKYAGMVRQHFPRARILYNVADLHFLRPERQAELEDDPELRQKAVLLRRLELGAMSFVDGVIVHSPPKPNCCARSRPVSRCTSSRGPCRCAS